MGHGEVAGKEWLRFFRGYAEGLIEAVRKEAATPPYEAALSIHGAFRAWRPRVRGNLERIDAMCG